MTSVVEFIKYSLMGIGTLNVLKFVYDKINSTGNESKFEEIENETGSSKGVELPIEMDLSVSLTETEKKIVSEYDHEEIFDKLAELEKKMENVDNINARLSDLQNILSGLREKMSEKRM